MKHAALISTAVAIACVAVVVRGAVTAPAPAPSRAIAPNERAHYAVNVAMEESNWQRLAAGTFGSDAWSRDDDFHAREAALIRDLTKERNASVEDVLESVDEDLHAGRGTPANKRRPTHAVPCKPRPFYD